MKYIVVKDWNRESRLRRVRNIIQALNISGKALKTLFAATLAWVISSQCILISSDFLDSCIERKISGISSQEEVPS